MTTTPQHDASRPAAPGSGARFLRSIARRSARHEGAIRFPALPSPEILTVLFVIGTAFAMSPVGRDLDHFLHLRIVTRDDGGLYLFFHDVLDRLSSQRVVGTLLLVVAVWTAIRRRTLLPLIVAGLAELWFVATGVAKIVLAKSGTKLGNPDWWDGGILSHGKYSMAYPSGHATESVLLWGAVLLILVLHPPVPLERLLRIGGRVWLLVMITTSSVSWLMGRHWVSDLASGLVFGLLGLTLLVGLVERGYPQALDELLRDRLVTDPARRRAPRSVPGGSEPRAPRRPHRA